MKLSILITTVLFPFFINAQIKYFDKDDTEISEIQFLNRQLKSGEFRVYNDSLTKGKIISVRNEIGTLNTVEFFNFINTNLQLDLDVNKPLVIVYYPGNDPCNSSGTVTPSSQHYWYKELIKKSNKITSTNFLFIYKSKDGLKYTKKDIWYQDPNGMIENKFFKYHYPCNSYTIIFKDTYISYFGEFSKENVLDDLKRILE